MANQLTFYVPPINQGQTVEVAYARLDERIIKRVTDRGESIYSPDRVRYFVAPAPDDFEPWNTAPEVAEWSACDKQIEQLWRI